MDDGRYYIYGVNGPVITVRGGRALPMMSLVYVGDEKIPGEVVSAGGDTTTVQVYEGSEGLGRGGPVFPTGKPMSILLGPGMLSNIYDGIARPLGTVADLAGDFISKGITLPALDLEKLWDVKLAVSEGQEAAGGMIFAATRESDAVEHRSLVPPGLSGKFTQVVSDGLYKVTDTLACVVDGRGRSTPISLAQEWPIRKARPIARRLPITRPLVTGQRVIDTLFPVGKGGCAAIPGPFGAGKTMVQHQLAKWSDADIIVYLGCGERGNEMTQVLGEFSELKDPKTGRPLMGRTILIANTSNMPVAAREASIYTGMTIAEYYRDMGYHVALMADSTSRWAEALREISGRLEEMPAEESFPAYLPSRLAGFYERAGYMETLAGREGSVTVIGAVSPQGGDFSEPVTQNTKRFIRTFWALDRALAYARHFPAIDWTSSYSEYFEDIKAWYEANFGQGFTELRQRILDILNSESALMEIVKLIGSDVLPDDQKLIIETAKLIRQGYLQQNAFHKADTYMPPEKQMAMLEAILYLCDEAKKLTAKSIPLNQLAATGIFSAMYKMKFGLGEGQPKAYFIKLIDDAISQVLAKNA
ncbi:MAG: V-type ATP synthase subunit A [Oscillospiraceae bacterium]|jgi:V/A-type H+-transporting ATPase subunit A|nr:V-type ATP synthase subunit A [Oscillospiraceae bacterium]